MRHIAGAELERIHSVERGLVHSMRELGFHCRVLYWRDSPHFIRRDQQLVEAHVAFRRWTCSCRQHAVEVHDCVDGLTPRQRSQLNAMVRCALNSQERGSASQDVSLGGAELANSEGLRAGPTHRTDAHPNDGSSGDRGQS